VIALEDTIAAVATARGAGGLAVVRVSGPAALACADAVFRGAAPLVASASHTLQHGWVIAADGARLDEVVAAVFRAPRSYTREDVVELSCHGGRLPAARVLEALLAAGARAAAPGEFTLRAFVHGRIDLAQAEAVADLIAAETDAARALAVECLAGALSAELDAQGERLRDLLAEVEARVDFAEDVGGVEVPPHVIDGLRAAAEAIAALLGRSRGWEQVRAGARVALAGAVNAGKSSLFNALLGEERALVTPEPGTTRDRVSEPLELGGVRVTLSDTAGLRDAADPVERLGVARARAALGPGGVVAWVVDASAPLGPVEPEVARAAADGTLVVALAKCDLPARTGAAEVRAALGARHVPVVETSARTGAGIADLRAVLAVLVAPPPREGGAFTGNPRHLEALAAAHAALAEAADLGAGGAPGELVASALRAAMRALDAVTGRAVEDDLLERVFARFCVGK
jgi:tRNA modification GTPase